MKVQNLRFCGTPLYRYVEFAGIHSDLFFASEGTASPNSTSALMTGRLRHVGFRAAGAAALIPSCAQKRSGSSSRSFKATLKGHAATAQADPDAHAQTHFISGQRKNRAPKSPVFAVKFSYATNQNPTGRLYPVQILLSNQTSH